MEGEGEDVVDEKEKVGRQDVELQRPISPFQLDREEVTTLSGEGGISEVVLDL